MKIRTSIPHPQTGKPQPGTVVDITEASEPVTQIKLANGTVARIRLVISEVVRLDEPGPDGKPNYHFNAQLATNLHHAEESADE